MRGKGEVLVEGNGGDRGPTLDVPWHLLFCTVSLINNRHATPTLYQSLEWSGDWLTAGWWGVLLPCPQMEHIEHSGTLSHLPCLQRLSSDGDPEGGAHDFNQFRRGMWAYGRRLGANRAGSKAGETKRRT